MNTLRKSLAVLALLAACATACLYGDAGPAVEYAGLTKMITSLLRSREPAIIHVGSTSIAVESLFAEDLAECFDCDADMSAYLESTDEPYYESLAEIIQSRMYGKFEGADGSVFAHVEAEGDDDRMAFGFYLSRTVLAEIPVSLRASDDSYRFSFTVPCPLRYEADIELLVDSATVNSDLFLDGVKIKIRTLSVELGFDPDDGDFAEAVDAGLRKPVRFGIDDGEYPARIVSCDIRSASYWYLSGTESDCDAAEESSDDAVTYAQLTRGSYRLDEANESSFDLAMNIETDDGERVFRCSVEDLRAADAFGYVEFE